MLSSIFNWSVVAILASFTMMPVSINRQTAPTVEPVTEAELKGCATNFESQGLIPFYYDSSKGFSKDAVENHENWTYVEDAEASCDNLDVKACAIRVSSSFVDNTGTQPQLKGTINLSASPDLSGSYFISGSSDSQMDIINKSN